MFSVAICNPPYSGNLHLRILEKVIPVAEEVVNISPISWLDSPTKDVDEKSDYNKFKETIANYINDIKEITASEADSIFNGQAFNTRIGIYKINKEGGYIPETNRIVEKIVNKLPSNRIQRITSVPEKYSVIVTRLAGGSGGRTEECSHWMMPKDKVFYIDGKNSNGETYYEYRKRVCWGNNKPKKEAHHYEFDTKQEMINFYDACETAFFRYVFKKELVGTLVNPKFLPIMSDYSKPWTNERFCEYFGITDEEWKEILTTMEKYK